MTRLPILNAKSMEIVNLGFKRVRQKESHVFYRHPDGRTTTLPHHSGRDLARPLLREILREIELPPEQLLEEVENLRIDISDPASRVCVSAHIK